MVLRAFHHQRIRRPRGVIMQEPEPKAVAVSWGFSLFRRAAFPSLGHPLVKSRKSVRICGNLNRALYFCDAHISSQLASFGAFSPIAPVPLIRSPCNRQS